MMTRSRGRCLSIAFMLLLPIAATAMPTYLVAARLEYPNIVNTPINSCALCHGSGIDRNPFGSDFGSNGHNFQAIENLDSDHDGFSNKTEIDALTWPGNSTSFPMVIAAIKVKKPRHGETWTIGSKVRVTWNSTGDAGENVTIELWQNGKKVVNLKNSTPNDGRQKVRVKYNIPPGSGFTVKVKSLSDPSVFDESNGTFGIDAGP